MNENANSETGQKSRRQQLESTQVWRRRARAGVTAVFLVDIVANTLVAGGIVHWASEHGATWWLAAGFMVVVVAAGLSAASVWSMRRRPEQDTIRDTTGLPILPPASASTIDKKVDRHLLLLVFTSAFVGAGLDAAFSGGHLFGSLVASIAALVGGGAAIVWIAARLFGLRGAPRLLPGKQGSPPLS